MRLLACLPVFPAVVFSYGQNKIESQYSHFDKCFNEITFDTLHVIPKLNSQIFDSVFIEAIVPVKIPDSLCSEHLATTNYYSISKFKMDGKGSIMGYLFYEETKVDNDFSIYFLIYSKGQMKTLYLSKVATYNTLEGSMETLMNSWIFDIDNDGVKDVATIIRTIDYEYPNELSGNISGIESYTNIYNNGKYVYSYWIDGLLEDEQLIH